MTSSSFMKKNTLSISIILFVLLFSVVNYIKPSIMYDEYGEIRPFGIGYSHKTIVPVWLFSILLAILCYLAARAIIIT